MLKLFSFLLIIPILFCSHIKSEVNLFDNASQIEIYNNGELIQISESEKSEFEKIFCETISDSTVLSSISIAINDDVMEDMKEGIWLRFEFDFMHVCNQMNFDSLLIKINKTDSAMNIIRGNGGVYEGRCFYIELENGEEKLFDYIEKLVNKDALKEVELEAQEIKETTVISEEGEEEKNKNKKNSVINIKGMDGKEENVKDKFCDNGSFCQTNNENIYENETCDDCVEQKEATESGISQKKLLEVLDEMTAKQEK